MTSKRTIAIVAATAIGLALAVGAVSAMRPQFPAYAAAIVGEHMAFGGRHHGSRHGGGHGIDRFCGHDHDERIEELIVFVDSFVDFTPEQAPAWADFSGALRASGVSVGEVCDELTAAGRPESAPEALGRIATVMEAGLEVVRELRAPFDAFYAALDAEQRAALDGLVAKGH